MESSLVAGGFLVFFVLNFVVLQNPHVFNRHRHESLMGAVKTELHSLARFKEKPHVLGMLISLFILLLPQALLFNTRVFFLLASTDEGGLGCSVQEVGFAQGTIGVLAFSLGVVLGRALMKKHGQRAMFWNTAVVLTFSPLSYWLMAREPQPDDLLLICCMTFFAQLCFGFGLNVCRPFITTVSQHHQLPLCAFGGKSDGGANGSFGMALHRVGLPYLFPRMCSHCPCGMDSISCM